MNITHKIRNGAALLALFLFIPLCVFLGGLKTDHYQTTHDAYSLGATWAQVHHANLASCNTEGLNGKHYNPGMWLRGCFDYATDAPAVRPPS